MTKSIIINLTLSLAISLGIMFQLLYFNKPNYYLIAFFLAIASLSAGIAIAELIEKGWKIWLKN